MRRFPYRLAAGLCAALTVAGVLVTTSPAFAQTTTPEPTCPTGGVSYSGDAYAVGLRNVTLLGSPINSGNLLGDTGPLPACGGTVSAPLGTVTLPGGLGSVTVTGGTVTGAGGAANASEKVAGLSLLSLTCSLVGNIGASNLPLLGSALNQLLADKSLAGNGGSGLLGGLLGGLSGCPNSSGTSGGLLSGSGGLLGNLLGGSSSSGSSGSGLLGGGSGSSGTGSGGLLGGVLGGTGSGGLLGLSRTTSTKAAQTSATSAARTSSGKTCLLGLNVLGNCNTSGSGGSGLLGGILPDLVDLGLVQTSAGAAAPGVTGPPNGQAAYPYEDGNIGTLSLLGGAVTLPINDAPNTPINLGGIVNITLNQQSYDSATNTASNQGVVINFPTNGLLSAVITGTIIVSSSTADTSGTLTCPSGITVTGISPTSGPVGGGTAVTITGTNFAAGATVAFGSSPASNVRVVSSTEITATSPAHAAGQVVVSVNNCPNSPALFTYTTTPAHRFGGPDRIQTAIAVSRAAFGNNSAGAVVLASDLEFQDGLTGVPLAAQKHGPLLLTEPTPERNGLNPSVLAEIERVLAPHSNKTVYLLGGYGTLSRNIDSTLSSLGYDPVREAGSSLYSTAVLVANAQGNPGTVFLVTGNDFADGLSAGPAAVHQGGVILYTNGSAMAPETAAYLAAHPADAVFAVGGPAAAADPNATPIVGVDEFATDTKVAAFFGNPAVIGVARGDLFPDALDGGTMVATNGGPIILVNPNVPVPSASAQYFIKEKSFIQTVDVFGGTLAVSPAVCSAINTDLGSSGSC